MLTRSAIRYPNRPAWLDGDTMVSFHDAEARVNRLANALIDLGGRGGDRVGMLLPNCHQGLETILAPIKAGMAVVPMNVRLEPREHEYLLNDSGAFALVYAYEFRDHLAGIRGSLDTVKHFICVGGDPDRDLGYDELLNSSSENVPSALPDSDDVAWLFTRRGPQAVPRAPC